MIVEKPRCPYCRGICGSNNPDPVYLKKIDDGWKCPQCNLEFYEKDVIGQPAEVEFNNPESRKVIGGILETVRGG